MTIKKLMTVATKAGLTVEQTAQLVDVTRQQVWFWTSGRNHPRPARAHRIKVATDVLKKALEDDNLSRKLAANPTDAVISLKLKIDRAVRASANATA